MAKYWDSLKTVLGYTHVVAPLWARYVSLVAAHPSICAWLILILLLVAIR